jgi:chaperone modulatory protein CbpM
MSPSYSLLVPRWRQRLLTLDQVAERCGLHPVLVKRLVTLGVIEPIGDAIPLYAPETVLNLQRVMRLRRDLGVNYSAAALILDLLERIEELESRLHHAQANTL